MIDTMMTMMIMAIIIRNQSIASNAQQHRQDTQQQVN